VAPVLRHRRLRRCHRHCCRDHGGLPLPMVSRPVAHDQGAQDQAAGETDQLLDSARRPVESARALVSGSSAMISSPSHANRPPHRSSVLPGRSTSASRKYPSAKHAAAPPGSGVEPRSQRFHRRVGAATARSAPRAPRSRSRRRARRRSCRWRR
jgi:hypothetical protein